MGKLSRSDVLRNGLRRGRGLLLLVLLVCVGSAREAHSDSQDKLFNNRHVVTPLFEFYAEPASYRVAAKDEPHHGDILHPIPLPRWDPRHRVYVVPRITLLARPTLFDDQGNKSGEATRAALSLSIYGAPLTRSDKRHMMAHFGNYLTSIPSITTATPEQWDISIVGDLDRLVEHYSFEYLSVSNLKLEVLVHGRTLGQSQHLGVVPMSSDFMVFTDEVATKAQLRSLQDGVFQVRATFDVDVSKVAEANLQVDFAGYLEALEQSMFRDDADLKTSYTKVGFIRERSQRTLSRYVNGQNFTRSNRRTEHRVALISRDASEADIQRLYQVAFPTTPGTAEEQLNTAAAEHREKAKNAQSDEEIRLHQSYAQLLESLKSGGSPENQANAQKEFADSVAALSGKGGASGAEAKARAGVAFLRAGFADRSSDSSSHLTVRRLRRADHASVSSGRFSISSATTVSRRMTLVRSDFRAEIGDGLAPELLEYRRALLLGYAAPEIIRRDLLRLPDLSDDERKALLARIENLARIEKLKSRKN